MPARGRTSAVALPGRGPARVVVGEGKDAMARDHRLALPRMSGTPSGGACRLDRPRWDGRGCWWCPWSSSAVGDSASCARWTSKRSRARGPSPRRIAPKRSAFAYTQLRSTPSCSASSLALRSPPAGCATATISATCSAIASMSSPSRARGLPRRAVGSERCHARATLRGQSLDASTKVFQALLLHAATPGLSQASGSRPGAGLGAGSPPPPPLPFPFRKCR
jgi:hypothetical protein